MQIRKKLQQPIVVSTITALFICLILFLVMQRVNRAMDVAAIAAVLATAVAAGLISFWSTSRIMTKRIRKLRDGAGNTVSFAAPLGVVEAENSSDAIVLPAVKTISAPQNEKKSRILIAEDDPIIRKVLKGMLLGAKYAINFAEDGQQAVEMWEEGNYDLVLMDLQMPRLTGFEATRTIREKELERGGHVPIVALTANAFKEDVEQCFAAGMDNYLSKPVDFEKSLQVIEWILELRNRLSDQE